MSLGSKRITIRVGDELYDDVAEAVRQRNELSGAKKYWTVTEYVIDALVDEALED